jgi:hypothetical protein
MQPAKHAFKLTAIRPDKRVRLPASRKSKGYELASVAFALAVRLSPLSTVTLQNSYP